MPFVLGQQIENAPGGDATVYCQLYYFAIAVPARDLSHREPEYVTGSHVDTFAPGDARRLGLSSETALLVVRRKPCVLGALLSSCVLG